MTEREISVEHAYQEFQEKGSIYLGPKEWDKIIFGMENLLKAYWAKNPMPEDDWQRKHEKMLLKEVYNAGWRKTAYSIDEDGKYHFYFLDTYIRRDENGQYITLTNNDGEWQEKPAETSEVVGYLCWELLYSRKFTLERVCKELFPDEA